MVVTSLPAARETGVTHDRTASPLRWTVHAPHSAIPQPNFVPVNPKFARTTQSSGVSGLTSTDCVFPLTFNRIIVCLLDQRKTLPPICDVGLFPASAFWPGIGRGVSLLLNIARSRNNQSSPTISIAPMPGDELPTGPSITIAK